MQDKLKTSNNSSQQLKSSGRATPANSKPAETGNSLDESPKVRKRLFKVKDAESRERTP